LAAAGFRKASGSASNRCWQRGLQNT
jgi:hypothetical protein